MREYKYIVFVIAVLAGVPIGAVFSAMNLKIRNLLIASTLFFSCYTEIHLNFFSMEWYRGTAKGFEITLVDLLSITLLFALMASKDRKFKFFPPGWGWYLLYFLFSAISILYAKAPLFSGFELWKMFRMWIFMLTMYNIFLRRENFDLIIKILRLIILFCFLVGLKQKYIGHYYQIESIFAHQNSMAMYMSVLGCFFLSAAYNRNSTGKDRFYDFATFGICSLLIIFSLSRGALIAFAMGSAITIFFSFVSGFNRVKFMISLFLCLCAFAVGIKVFQRVYERYMYAPESSGEARIVLAKMAAEMANSNIFGVGLNNFAENSNKDYIQGVSMEERARMFREGVQIYRHQLVETTYMMIAAECGWITLVIFLCLLLYYYFVNFGLIIFLRKKHLQYICIGWAGGLFSIYFQTVFEWVLKQPANYYQLMLIFASIAAMKTLRKEALKRKKTHGKTHKKIPHAQSPELTGSEQTHIPGPRTEQEPHSVEMHSGIPDSAQ